MNSRVLGLRVASGVFGLMCLGQLLRLVMRIGVNIGSHPVPMWISGVAVLVLAALCAWLWRLSSDAATPAAPPPTV